ELVAIRHASVQEQCTLPLGALRLLDQGEGNLEAVRGMVKVQLDRIEWLEQVKDSKFYAVGGSFRALARLHMRASRYPLAILHQYEVEAGNMLDYLDFLLEIDEEKLARLPGMQAKRLAIIPIAAEILKQLLQATGARDAVFCASGIR